MKLEQMRHKEMLEHEIRLKELDNERRREERQHELMLLNLLNNNRNPYPPQMMDFFKGNNSGPSGSERSYFATASPVMYVRRQLIRVQYRRSP